MLRADHARRPTLLRQWRSRRRVLPLAFAGGAASHHADHVRLRRVNAVDGEARVRMVRSRAQPLAAIIIGFAAPFVCRDSGLRSMRANRS